MPAIPKHVWIWLVNYIHLHLKLQKSEGRSHNSHAAAHAQTGATCKHYYAVYNAVRSHLVGAMCFHTHRWECEMSRAADGGAVRAAGFPHACLP